MRSSMRLRCAVVVLGLLGVIPTMAWAADGTERSFFGQFVWPGGGVIGLLLIAMDIASIALIIQFLVTIRKETLAPTETFRTLQDLFQQKKYREAIETTAVDQSFLSHVMHACLHEAPHGLTSMERAMEEAAEQRTTSLYRRVEILNIIGNLAPMLGLMGTVLGMILAFNEIVKAGGVPDAPQLADDIGIALVTTFWGLVVAVPALAVYSYLRNRIDALAAEAVVAADGLLSIVRENAQKG